MDIGLVLHADDVMTGKVDALLDIDRLLAAVASGLRNVEESG